ncbi:MAG: quinone-dependent dihydroorotate dehydrogenase [Hahellaceae bacterium]|nr:quinone-dependent dihydroorotate dehydrogenase [Hahellaceae bacterium]
MSYKLLRDLLFVLPPEMAHEVSLDLISAGERLGISKLFSKPVPDCPVEVMGIKFPNPVGLAAGLDKNGAHIDGLAALGFGFIEVGTVTPKAQPGNPRPRLFRLKEAEAIINRMGFNNEGIDQLIENLATTRYKGPLGINVGKNLTTSVEDANNDYLAGIRKAYPHADYITVNVSSPNTPGLRNLQFGESLNRLLDVIKVEQAALNQATGRYVPIAVKIAPDMTPDEVQLVAKSLLSHGMDGVIATNTTLSRESVEGLPNASEAGGLSGTPVKAKSTEVIRLLKSEVGDLLPIIGVGGISDAASAVEKIDAGASLIQVYTGFIYRGPELIKSAVEAIRSWQNCSAVK